MLLNIIYIYIYIYIYAFIHVHLFVWIDRLKILGNMSMSMRVSDLSYV